MRILARSVMVVALLVTGAVPLASAATLPALAVADVSIVEGNSGTKVVKLRVALSRAVSRTVKVDYATVQGTAKSPADFQSRSGTLSFLPGQRGKNIAVTIKGDLRDEFNEAFTVKLSSPVRARIIDGVGKATIEDNDAPPLLSISNSSLPEGDSGDTPATVSVNLSQASGKTVRVDWATTPGLAQAGSDYLSASGELVFAPGNASQPVGASVIGDGDDEALESFTFDLSNPVNASIADSTGEVDIINDDDPTISVADISFVEGTSGTSTVAFEATLSNASIEPVTVQWVTAPGTATAGQDYSSATGTVTFVPGDQSEPIDVTIQQDYLDEPDETFVVNLSSPTNASVTDFQATATIQDDDLACVSGDTPGSGLFLGSVAGDTGSDQFTRVDTISPCGDSDFFNFQVVENNNNSVYLSARVTLTYPVNDSPSAGDLDLCIYGGSVGGPSICSTLGPGQTEVLCIWVGDDFGAADDFTTVAKVDGFGNAVNNYQLQVVGNVDVNGCDPNGTLQFDV